MRIALDFDDTYTLDTEFWDSVIASAKSRGHTVTFVTYRYEPEEGYIPLNDDIRWAAKRLGIEAVFTGGQQKAGLFGADVWIDDQPVSIPVASELNSMYHGCVANEDYKERVE